jgi:hypothetical protein
MLSLYNITITTLFYIGEGRRGLVWLILSGRLEFNLVCIWCHIWWMSSKWLLGTLSSCFWKLDGTFFYFNCCWFELIAKMEQRSIMQMSHLFEGVRSWSRAMSCLSLMSHASSANGLPITITFFCLILLVSWQNGGILKGSTRPISIYLFYKTILQNLHDHSSKSTWNPLCNSTWKPFM